MFGLNVAIFGPYRMATLNIVFVAILCIVALSQAASRRKNQIKGKITVEGTLYLNIPNDIPEPEHIMIMIKVGDQKPTESQLPWKLCAKNKKCPYKVRNIAANVGQKFAVGVHLNYVDNFMGMNVHNDSLEKLEEWTSATMEIKGEVTNQDIFYDIAGQRVTPLHPGHDMEKQIASLRTSAPPSSGTPISSPVKEPSKTENETGLPVDVTVQGTVEVILPAPLVGSTADPKPAGVFIQLKLNRDAKRHETNIPWEQCTANRCPYTIENVHGIEGQTYTVGVTDYYYGESKRDRHNNTVWSQETGELKAGENKQDIKYNKVQSTVTLVVLSAENQPHSSITSTLTATSSGTSSTSTSHVIPPATTSVVQPASPVIPSVSTLPSHMTQPVSSGVTQPASTSTTSVISSAPTPTVPVVHSTPLSASPVITPASVSSSVGLAMTSKITVEGTVRVNLPADIPKPDGIIIYLQLEGQTSPHLRSAPWPTECPDSKCQYDVQYSITDVVAYDGQKYSLGVSLVYSPFGSNRGKPNREEWSAPKIVSKIGVIKENITYNAAKPEVV